MYSRKLICKCVAKDIGLRDAKLSGGMRSGESCRPDGM